MNDDAGGGIGAAALDVDPSDFDAVVATNVRAPCFPSQAPAGRPVKFERPGRIVGVRR